MLSTVLLVEPSILLGALGIPPISRSWRLTPANKEELFVDVDEGVFDLLPLLVAVIVAMVFLPFVPVPTRFETFDPLLPGGWGDLNI